MGNANRKRSAAASNPLVENLCSDLGNLSLAKNQGKGEEKQEAVRKNDVSSSSSSLSAADDSRIDESSDDDETQHLYTTAVEEASVQMFDEDVVADYRGRLYRFESETKQWRERAVGKICILQSRIQKHQYRVVMWRDGTLVVVCNFRLFPEFMISDDRVNPKTARWHAMDFSDVQMPKWSTFACRFNSVDERNDFKTRLAKYALEYVPSKDLNDESNCPGCVGCNPETFEFPQQIQIHGKFECIIDCKLDFDSCAEVPRIVEPKMFK